MSITRRTALSLPLLGAASTAMAQGGASGWAPDRPVRIVVPFAPGGSTDVSARLIAQAIAPKLGRPVVVENRPGATSTIGTAEVARAAPDGHTLLVATTPFVITQFAFASLPYDPEGAFRAVGQLTSAPMMVGVRAELPARSFAELIALIRAQPGALSYASVGEGSLTHVATELLSQRAGLRMLHVPYRGSGPAMVDLAGGRVDMMLTAEIELLPQVQAGRTRILAVATPSRLPRYPDLPAVAEMLPGYRAEFWSGLVVPAATPDPAVARLNAVCNEALAQPEIVARLAELGAMATPDSPAAFAGLLQSERAQWSEAVRRAGIRVG
ncbi:MAG: tripartite tricarboxylate transporter substrate binding protein [Acetobacteraceae bacterium]|nr:tripartite tricarboxylate transporter substrate binding protein [Acetobacteraceae bacterium]